MYFGAWVTLEDEEGNEHKYRLVGPDEFDVTNNLISVDSPMAKALLRKQEGDEVTIRSPDGERIYEILEVAYH